MIPLDSAIIVAIVSGAFTFLGSLIGVIASSKLTQYRLKQLEDKVNKHNCVVERTYKLEGQVTELQHDVRDIKSTINHK